MNNYTAGRTVCHAHIRSPIWAVTVPSVEMKLLSWGKQGFSLDEQLYCWQDSVPGPHAFPSTEQ